MVEVLSWSELVARAGSPARAKTLVRTGLYQAVLRGVYLSDAEDRAAPEVRAAAARRGLPPGRAAGRRPRAVIPWLSPRPTMPTVITHRSVAP